MNDSLKPAVAIIAGPRCGSMSLINYFKKCHKYNFEHCRIPTNKPNTIYLFRIPATYNRHNSKLHQSENSKIDEFIEKSKLENVITISLIRDPISQLLSIYHKLIDNNYTFDNIRMHRDASFDTFIQYRNYNSIIHKSLESSEVIIDIEKKEYNQTNKKLNINIKFINQEEISSSRGKEFWIKHFNSKHLQNIYNSESYKIYLQHSNLANQ